MNGNLKLSDDKLLELQAQLGIYQNHALGYHEGELGVRTRMGWDYYYGNLPEPVQKGSSKWVDRTVWESVNGTLQELVSVFTSGSDAVKFAPVNSEDGVASIAATKMVNKILLRENQGYNVLNDAFKECLVTRNSFVKRYWQSYKDVIEEDFSEMTQQEFDTYLMNIEGEIQEMSSEEDDNGLISGSIKYEKLVEGVKVEYVPFEQVIIEPTATSLRDTNYIAHRVRKTKDQLIKMGFPMEIVEEMNPASSDITAGVIANARVNNLTPLNVSDVLSVGDKHSDKIWLYEHYIRTSCATGRLETLQVFTIHTQILEVNRVSEHPFETFSPFPVPGTIWGESVFDITKDIQDLNTNLVRGIIDNVMNANFRRYMAVKGAYDRQSLLNNRPGGVVEVQSLGAVTPMDYHQLPNGITQLLEYTESKKEMRTGVSRVGQGLDPNVFKNDNSTATVNMVMTAAQNRLRMVARNIAQRGMMELMLGIYELVRQNGSKPIPVETAQGVITIDPKTLPPRSEMVVSVAVGDGERRERSAAIQAALMTFTQVPQMNKFFQDNNAYHMGSQLLESLGLYDVENFITPLDKLPEPQPNPAEQAQLQLMMEQVKNAQVMTQKLMSDIQNEREKLVFEQQKAADEMTMRKEESLSKQDESADKVSLEAQRLELERLRLELEEQKIELKRQTMLIEAQMESRQARAVDLGRIK
ncbi:putative portal protein [Aeromonas phage LAh_9]|uniref:Portal protein n=4 Tax=Lahexavirus TaxID=2843411 RepID=A0A5B9NC94_9CAUD|nr:portal protein [Aeromonas phage 4_4572]YP_009847181.1 portal protein [Aeromonas phage LAh_6]YP_009847404.1 portal protein [Aeromonas phage LAh_8]YP_009847487.1 portal protein [Aeromonas phage LAh_9]QDH46482.1 putative portal protein [Aeromonas phage LAh_6]QDH46720.1 putative portal protein [Aeromonas phage LAh_8]QDH46863.1 putative portal protein [Aeromonas phage LAh_9]QEG09081.1 portal protein [Aeromonas phage 4_4572]